MIIITGGAGAGQKNIFAVPRVGDRGALRSKDQRGSVTDSLQSFSEQQHASPVIDIFQ